MLRWILPTLLTLTHLSAFAAKTFIGLGEEGRSGHFNNIVTVYIDSTDPQFTDPQFRCLGCFHVRVIYDAKNYVAGAPFARHVAVNTKSACGPQGKTSKPAEMLPLYRNPLSPLKSEAFMIQVDPGLCKQGTEVELQFIAPKCLNPMNPVCDESEVVQSYILNIKEIGDLDPVQSIPNKKK